MFVYKEYDADTCALVLELLASGLTQTAVAQRTGVSRGTVHSWARRAAPPRSVVRRQIESSWAVTDARSYCYLLGVYLGDGTVCRPRGRHVWLQVVNDRRYSAVSAEILDAMQSTFPESRPRMHPSSVGESDVLCVSHPCVERAFPQHGPGRKHARLIQLAPWQLELTHGNPDALIRGLIHSDGCRTENRFKTKLPSGRVAEYSYVRYFFTNHSEDIREIFIQHSELLGVRVTQSNYRNLSISHRKSVAILEQIVGPKS
jgi:hypothetical protein